MWPWFSLYLKPKMLPEEDLDLLVTESEAALERVSQRNCHSIVFCLQQKICVVERVDSNRTHSVFSTSVHMAWELASGERKKQQLAGWLLVLGKEQEPVTVLTGA